MNILTIDDDPQVGRIVGTLAQEMRHSHWSAASGKEGLNELRKRPFDVVFLDVNLPVDMAATGNESIGRDGLALIEPILQEQPQTQVVMVTGVKCIKTTVLAMQKGAKDYVTKPFSLEDIEQIFRRVEEFSRLRNKVDYLETVAGRPGLYLQSRSEEMRNVILQAQKAAQSDATILLTGESGTGKTALAQAIHDWSNRRDRPFGTVACPTLSAELLASELFGHVRGAFTGATVNNPGRVAKCDGGTLFLDEIGTLPESLQVKLLRFLQDYSYERVGDTETRKANVRVIAATNLDLSKAIQDGRFREDLFFRLNVIEIHVPPLRKRKEDLAELSDFLYQKLCQRNGRVVMELGENVKRLILSYDWPGNIRELQNYLERLLILGENTPLRRLAPVDARAVDANVSPSGKESSNAIGEQVSGSVGSLMSLEELEKAHISAVLQKTDSFDEAAKILGINQATLWRKRKQFEQASGEKASAPEAAS